jgi:type I restriction-modification system DNA methylase subunit
MPLIHESLFNPRFLQQRIAQQPTPAGHKKLLHDWATVIRSGAMQKQKESEVRAPFIQKFFVEILGYRPIGSGGDDWTINDEKRTGSGSADTALGFFSAREKQVVAPVELKGADTPDLDAIMPGRHKSPVMQAWEYAMDTPECQFLLVSNMVEIRLYAVGHTRQVYERFNVLELADSDAAYWRFRLLLDADRLLNGETARLLKASGLAEKEITNTLYANYKTWRIQLLTALAQASGKPVGELIAPTQKLLDRILFIAFAEDRGLLPPKSLTNAGAHRDPYNPRPIWENFLGLFRAIDKGNPELNVPAYNGGLFAPDPALDALPVSDESCKLFSALGEYDFAEDVSVSVLGHIFEQSVSDLEQLKELAGEASFTLDALKPPVKESSRSTRGKRKEEGIVYTPDAITRFIVDQTLGAYLEAQRAKIQAEFCNPEGDWRKPSKKETADYTGKQKQSKLKNTERLVEFLFWMAWRDKLCALRVVDPACGSGAFLVAAFDVLDAEYRRANEQIQAITGTQDLFGVNREILNSNLYGVDLNPESIEITKLSLWLKTAQRGKPLESLEANLRIGDSLIDDGQWSDRAFDWRSAFPRVFADGGFDVVLGNPPYVRMERLKFVKPYLEKRYAVASDRADLYCYFYELGVSLLKPGGRMGYISSSTFFKTGSGEPLRRYLLENTRIKTLLDFGDIQVFEGVTTYPVIVVLERGVAADSANAPIRFLKLDKELPESLALTFAQQAETLPQARLGAGSWQLENDALARLRQKLTAGHKTLKEVYGSPLYGIKTGLNDAFVVDRATRDRLLAEDPCSEKLLKPFLEGKDLKKWRIEPQDLWLIYIPKNRIDIDDYPAIKAHLLPFREKLEKRATKQAWFELQQAQEAYLPMFEASKIYYPDMSQGPKFVCDAEGRFAGNTSYFIPGSSAFLLALLNSRLSWFHLCGKSEALRGGEWRLRLFSENVETIPVPDAPNETRNRIASLAESAQGAAEERRDLLRAFARRVLTDLAPSGKSARLSARLADWPSLNFKTFQEELKKQYKTVIPLDERDAWQARFEKDRARVIDLNAQIARCEKAIDTEVYKCFDLTPEEIALIEAAP